MILTLRTNCLFTSPFDIEIAACEHPSRHHTETNQHTYLCPEIGVWKLQLVAELVVMPFDDRATVCDFQSQVRFLNMFELLSATDFDRATCHDR